MASGITSWGTNQLLATVLGLQPAPTQFYIALTLYEPGADTDGTVIDNIEPVDTAYSRVPYNNGALTWVDPNGLNYTVNSQDILFPVPSQAWGILTHFALCSAAVAGEVYFYGEFDIPPNPDTDSPFVIPAGSIALTFSSQTPSIVPT